MERILLFILLVFFIPLKSPGQHETGIKLNGGFSKLIIEIDLDYVTQKFYFVGSGQTGVYYNFHLGQNSLFGVEILYSRIGGKSKELMEVTTNYGIQHLSYTFLRHISYLSIPFYYGIKTDKLTSRIGFQAAMALTSSEDFEYEVPSNFIVMYSGSGELEIKKYDYGLIAGIIYSISDRFLLEATYYYGLSNIYNGNSARTTWKIQQITAGFRYSFYRKRE